MNFGKKIEIFFKKIFKKFIYPNNKPILIDRPYNIFENEKNLKVLLLRQDRIGDVLITTPILPFFKKSDNISVLDILLSNKNIVAGKFIESHVNKIHLYSKKITDIIKLLIKPKFIIVDYVYQFKYRSFSCTIFSNKEVYIS